MLLRADTSVPQSTQQAETVQRLRELDLARILDPIWPRNGYITVHLREGTFEVEGGGTKDL